MVRLFGTDSSFDSKCIDDLDALFEVGPTHTLAGVPSAPDGYYVVIRPLSKGKHVVELLATTSCDDCTYKTKYTLTVE